MYRNADSDKMKNFQQTQNFKQTFLKKKNLLSNFDSRDPNYQG